MNIVQRLKEETEELHQKVENNLPLLKPGLQPLKYRSIVMAFFGFYKPFEEKLDALPEVAVLIPEWDRRRKAALLHRDLEMLGCSSEEAQLLPLCERLPEIRTIPQALGCLYVLEGSSLGGQIISRHLRANLALGVDNGAAFFNGYGSEVGAMWKSFKSVLVAKVGKNEEDETVEAAKETFRCLDNWLERELNECRAADNAPCCGMPFPRLATSELQETAAPRMRESH